MTSELKKIAKKFNLRFIVLFGSAATKKTHKESDIDIAVYPEKKLPFKKEVELRYELSSLFQREIDMSFFDRAPPLLLGQIARYGKLLAGDKKIYQNFRIQAVKEYLDFEPYFLLREKKVKQLVKTYA